MELSDSIKLKLNGTFGRELYLLDKDDKLYSIEFRIQTALWIDPATQKKCYVSIFPNFIKRYCLPCLNVLEYISYHLGKDEDIFRYIDDPKELLYCSDNVTGALKLLEKKCIKVSYLTLLNSKYSDGFDRPLIFELKNPVVKKFLNVYALIVSAKKFFGRQSGVLSIVNSTFRI